MLRQFAVLAVKLEVGNVYHASLNLLVGLEMDL